MESSGTAGKYSTATVSFSFQNIQRRPQWVQRNARDDLSQKPSTLIGSASLSRSSSDIVRRPIGLGNPPSRMTLLHVHKNFILPTLSFLKQKRGRVLRGKSLAENASESNSRRRIEYGVPGIHPAPRISPQSRPALSFLLRRPRLMSEENHVPSNSYSASAEMQASQDNRACLKSSNET